MQKEVIEVNGCNFCSFSPRIEIFNPFEKPFENSSNTTRVVSNEVIEYMNDDSSKMVAKCTPCQCCACR